MTAGIEQELIKCHCAPTAPATQGTKPLGEDQGRGGPAAHRRVDRRFQPRGRDAGTGEVDDGAGRRCAPEAVHGDHVRCSKRIGGVDQKRSLSSASDPRHGELDDVRSAPVEAVEAGGGFVADGSRRPEAQQSAHLAALDRVRRSSDREDARRDLDEPSVGQHRPPMVSADAERVQLSGRDQPVLSGG